MNKRELLEQLKGIIEYAKDNRSDDCDEWEKDIECCQKCIQLVKEFVDDHGNIIYDKKTFDTEDEARAFKEELGDKYRGTWHVTYGNQQWWTVDYKL